MNHHLLIILLFATPWSFAQTQISATPSPCQIQAGSETCQSNIIWNNGHSHGGLFLRETGQLVGFGSSGTYAATYINSQGYNFDVREKYTDSNSKLLATIFIKGKKDNTPNPTPPPSPTPPIAPPVTDKNIWALPSVCHLANPAATCQSQISWQTTSPQAGIFLRETAQLVGYGSKGEYLATYININGYNFDIRENYADKNSPLIDSVFVQGIVGAITPASIQVGVIRWDAWFMNPNEFTTNLSPSKWHYRLPFYAQTNPLIIRSDSQLIMDQEISYAASAGINYWAFVYYHGQPEKTWNNGLELYLSSNKKSQLNFSLILQGSHLGTYNDWPKTVKELAKYFSNTNYQKVLNGRPLVYLFDIESFVKIFGLNAKQKIQELRNFYKNQHGKELYIVAQTWDSSAAKKYIHELGLDAAGAYSNVDSSERIQKPYSVLANANKYFWNSCKDLGLKVVPTINTGWDPSPRWEMHGEKWNKYGVWYEPAKDTEIAQHLNNAIQWTKSFSTTAESNTILIYAWNEFDEGGWIAPTLQQGNSRLNAIKNVLLNK